MINIPKSEYLNTILSGNLCCSFTICYYFGCKILSKLYVTLVGNRIYIIGNYIILGINQEHT